MDIELHARLRGGKKKAWKDFLTRMGLESDEEIEQTVLIWEDDAVIATGSRRRNLLKCIAVDEAHQGEGLTASLLTMLRQEAFREGYRHLFLYTKPQNERMFASLLFYPVAKTDSVLLMEDQMNGICGFIDSLPKAECSGVIGSAVMNCNPFTLGHRYLVETAAKECDHLYVFVLSENESRYSDKDRLEMVKRGVADLKNVTVLPTGPYLISSVTFPTYFLKEREKAGRIQCLLDIEIFARYFVPHFSIDRRYVGSEPLSQMTNQYNTALVENLPEKGVEVAVIDRLQQDGSYISASTVRDLLDKGNVEAAEKMLPATTFDYLRMNHLI